MTLTLEKRSTRITADLARQVQPLLRRGFLDHVAAIRDELTIRRIQGMLARGAVNEAVEVARTAAGLFTRAWGEAFVRAAEDTVSKARLLTFDRLRPRVVEAMRASSIRLASGLAESQREVVRATLARGIARGDSTLAMARRIRENVGLTSYHEGVVANYRRALETRSRSALDRVLRDQRFDPSVRRALEEGRDLAPKKIDRMVSRYRDRMLTHRAQAVARTEATAAVEAGRSAAIEQAVAEGRINRDEVERVWRTQSSNVRDSHSAMSGQVRGYQEAFLSGAGVPLRYPGDETAPASERANCRCRTDVRLRAPE